MKDISTKTLAPFLRSKVKQHGKQHVINYLMNIVNSDDCAGQPKIECSDNEYLACVDGKRVCIPDL